MKEINIGLLGCGQVGTGVLKLLRQQRDFIEKRTGLRLNVKRVLVRHLNKARAIATPSLTDDLRQILLDKDISIIVELVGGLEPARTYILKSLQAGKAVVTANKAVLAHYGREIMAAADKTGCPVYYEASCLAGVPVIRAIKEGLLANHISVLMGIFNGTTNYILTQMDERGLSVSEALKEAQAKGFAEPDPAHDLSGIDSAHKLNILASLAFGIPIKPEEVYKESIVGIEPEDIKNAREFGYVIKLLAIAREVTSNKVELRVHPTMIPRVHPLAAVRNEFNALYLYGNAVGEMMFYGKGAGPLPTASAILADIVLALGVLRQASEAHDAQRTTHNAWGNKAIIPMGETVSRHYLRFPIKDKPGVIGKIATVLGKRNISIYGATAALVSTGRELGHVRVFTKEARESVLQAALAEINRLAIMRGKAVMIRIEE